MSTDAHGFVYPKVDSSLCTECHKCEKICAFTNDDQNRNSIKRAYAFALHDRKALRESTSGGAFTAISNLVLSNGGLVAGSVLDADLSVHHILTDDFERRDQMRKSKYVQSDTEGIFKEVSAALENGRMVLFVGTPCQCGQMIRYAGKNTANLITCDFLCHGVPSHSFFKGHIAYLEKLFGEKVIQYAFRDKEFGWSHTEGVQFASGKWNYSKRVQSYRKFFYDNVTLRPSCLSCPYRSAERCADLTIADYWGVNKQLKDNKFPHDNRGVSLIMVSSDKGLKIAEQLDRYGTVYDVQREDIQFKFSSTVTKVTLDEKQFWETFDRLGYEGLVKKYISYSWKKEIIFTLKNWGRKLLRG